MKCMVFNCKNTSKLGSGIKISVGILDSEHWMCHPCFEFLTKGSSNGNNSQLARNGHEEQKASA